MSTVATTSALRPIEDLWNERCQALADYEGDDRTFDDAVLDRSYWDRIDAAEAKILNHPSTGPRATEVRLWVAWWHSDHSHGTAVAAGDVDHLRSVYADFDWHEKLLFSAILNLRGETL